MEPDKTASLFRNMPDVPHGKPGDARTYEPVFTLPQLKGLTPDNDRHGKNSAFLAHRISRTPKNLKNHVLRINLHIQRRNSAALWGALLDLFLVLKSSGAPLRQRLLAASARVLNKGQYHFLKQYLEQYLEQGLPNDCTCPKNVNSVLSGGLSGSLHLVQRVDSFTPKTLRRDPLTEALDYLAYGQTIEAQAILESAIRAEPSRKELHYELLNIYRSTRSMTGFMSMHESISLDENPVPDAWDEVADFLTEHQ